MAITEKALGREHPKTATNLSNLALLGDPASARPLFERVLAIREKTLGAEHPDTATSLTHLGRLLQRQGDLATAQLLLERALAIREKWLGQEHPATGLSRIFLYLLFKEKGDLGEARLLFERVVAMGEKAFERDPSLLQRYANPYARMLLGAGRTVEALTIAQSALAALETAYSGNHPWIKDSARVTADALDALGRTEEAKELRERYGLMGHQSEPFPWFRPI